jgi:hypothetical protein
MDNCDAVPRLPCDAVKRDTASFVAATLHSTRLSDRRGSVLILY